MPLFDVAITLLPTKEAAEKGTETEKLVLGPKTVVATNEQSAAMQCTIAEAKALGTLDAARLKVYVRPF